MVLLLFSLFIGFASPQAGRVAHCLAYLGGPLLRARRHWWLLGLSLLLGAGSAAGQGAAGRPRVADPHHRIDSVEALVRAHPQPDTVRVKLLMNLVSELMLYDTRSAGPVLSQTLRLARQVKYRDLLAEALLMDADYCIGLARYDDALHWLNQAQAEFARLHDVGGQMRCLGRRTRIADQQGHYAEALDYAFRGMAISSVGNERRFHTSLRIQVASVYARIGEYQLARAHLLDALRIARHYDYPDRINLILGELGEVSRYQHQWPAARRYYAQSRAVSQQLSDLPDVLRMDLNLAEMSEQLDDASTRTAAYGVLRRVQAAHQLLLLPRMQALLARASLRAGLPDSAIWYGTRSLQRAQQNRAQADILAASAVLARAYAQRHDFAQAYEAQQRFVAYSDSIGGAEMARRTAALQLSYERRQQRAQLLLLSQRQELDRLHQRQRQGALAGALVLLALVGAGLLWRYRLHQQRRETALRNRLAADLHDDVGSLLSQISLQSGLLQEGLADGAGQRQQLGQISEASRSAVRQLNDVVWSIDAHNDHLPNLLDRMRDYAYEVLGAAGLGVTFDLPPDLPAQRLPVLLRRNLYLIFKESLHNAVKHARGATTVAVRLHLDAQGPLRLVLEVADDGQPLATAPAGPARRSGHGLRNMQARAQALGGTATSGAGPTGFRVQVVVPLPTGWRAHA